MRILILKDNYNSFENFYLEELKKIYPETFFYYSSNSRLRKLWTHYGLPFEHVWYGQWKAKINKFDLIIVFDSIHSTNMLKYLHKHTKARVIFWHWNPILTAKDKEILEKTRNLCEHWTFNKYDAEKYGLYLNNQFYFYQENSKAPIENSAFFVGADKGRYNQLIELSSILIEKGINPDFHIVDANKVGKYYQKNYMQYDTVLKHMNKSKYLIEIVQEDQNGLTARSLEAMFLRKKLITNNTQVKKCSFFDKNNIFVINDGEDINSFLETPFQNIDRSKLFRYSAEGWMENFNQESRKAMNKEVEI